MEKQKTAFLFLYNVKHSAWAECFFTRSDLVILVRVFFYERHEVAHMLFFVLLQIFPERGAIMAVAGIFLVVVFNAPQTFVFVG